MTPVAAVLVGHLLGDWVAQTDWQAANKMRSWRANQMHMLTYHLVFLPMALWAFTWRAAVLTVVVSWVTHSIIDRRWPVEWLMRHTGSAPFSETTFGVVAVDQALHLSILLLLAGTLR